MLFCVFLLFRVVLTFKEFLECTSEGRWHKRKKRREIGAAESGEFELAEKKMVCDKCLKKQKTKGQQQGTIVSDGWKEG